MPQSQGEVILLARGSELNWSDSGRELFGEVNSTERLTQLAYALAASPLWQKMPETALVVRESPRPVLAAMGRFTSEELARLNVLPGQLNQVLRRLRYVTYAQAERDAQTLAAGMLERFGRAALREFTFVGVPRGGMIVLGLLAYTLDLQQQQLIGAEAAGPDHPVVIVDDCSITGARFRQSLQAHPNRRVIFAPFYSHPELRAAIVNAEPRVEACLSARDLNDYTPNLGEKEYETWKNRWTTRSSEAYWIGQPDHICFPWNEPDVGFWNAETQQVERGWRLVPPRYCVKNRAAPDKKNNVTVMVQPRPAGPLRPAKDVIYGTVDSQIVVGNLSLRTSFCLDGVAAAMWRAIIKNGSKEKAVLSLLQTYDIEPSTLEADLGMFCNELIEAGLLEPRENDCSIAAK